MFWVPSNSHLWPKLCSSRSWYKEQHQLSICTTGVYCWYQQLSVVHGPRQPHFLTMTVTHNLPKPKHTLPSQPSVTETKHAPRLSFCNDRSLQVSLPLSILLMFRITIIRNLESTSRSSSSYECTTSTCTCYSYQVCVDTTSSSGTSTSDST